MSFDPPFDLRQAASVLSLAGELGTVLWADGDRLRYRSPGPLPPDLANHLRACKEAILALLAGALLPGLPTEDERDLREERAGILEFEAGMSRANAEVRAGLR